MFVSAAAAMPDVSRQDVAAARGTLAELGARTVVRTEYEDGAAEGVVFRTEPPAGEPVPYEVAVYVAEPPSSVVLTDLRSVGATCSIRREVVVNGASLDASLQCGPNRDEVEYLEYALNRDVSRFEAVIGQDDRGVTTATIHFRVLLDDVLAGEWSLPFGASEQISVDVKGHLRIRLETFRDNLTEESLDTRAVWGEPRFVGSTDAIDRLVENS